MRQEGPAEPHKAVKPNTQAIRPAMTIGRASQCLGRSPATLWLQTVDAVWSLTR
jgi:hypothetical protein